MADNGSATCFGSFEMAGEPCRDLTLERDVFADCGPAVYSFQIWSEDRFASDDRNLFFDSDGSYLVDGCRASPTWTAGGRVRPDTTGRR